MSFCDSHGSVLGACSACGEFLSQIVSVEGDEVGNLLPHDVRHSDGLSLCDLEAHGASGWNADGSRFVHSFSQLSGRYMRCDSDDIGPPLS